MKRRIPTGTRRPDGRIRWATRPLVPPEADRFSGPLQPRSEHPLVGTPLGVPGVPDTILDVIPCGIVHVDRDGGLVRANANALDFLGLSLEGLRNLTVEDFEARTVRDDGSPFPIEDYPVVRCLATGQRQDPEVIGVRRPDGETSWGIFTAMPLPGVPGPGGDAVVTIVDVTELRAVEEELRRSQQRLESIFETVPAFIMSVNPDFTITFINRTTPPHTPESTAGTSMFEYVPPEDHGKVRTAFARAIRTGEAATYRTRYEDIDGTNIHFETWVGPLKRDGRVISLTVVALDVTASVEMEESIQKMKHLDSLGVLAGGIAHDFNNYLMGILASVTEARRSGDLKIARACLKRSEKAILEAGVMTRQLLTFSRGGEPARTPVDSLRLVRDTAEIALEDSAFGYELISNGTPWPIMVDESQIRQVLQNIIRNAQQAMTENDPASAAPARRIRIEIANTPEASLRDLPLEGEEFVRISIRDEGHGIPAEVADRIFDPFFTTRKRGTGLGLSTCYSIVRRHEGHIRVRPPKGGGTTFDVFLPRSLEAPVAARPVLDPPRNGGGRRVLLMDDQEEIRRSVQMCLEMDGFEVHVADDPDRALEAVRDALAAGRRFEAALLDLTIPGHIGGAATLRTLHGEDPELVGIAMSGYSENPVIADPAAFGFAAGLAKPFLPADLSRILIESLPPRKARPPAASGTDTPVES